MYNSYIFENNIYCIKNNKIWIYSKNMNNKLSTKVIKKIIYKDDNFTLILDNLKKNIYNIDQNIEMVFLLKLFYKIKINKKSFIKINYYNYESKLINVTYKTKLNEFFT